MKTKLPKVDIYDETHGGLLFLARRVKHPDHRVRYAGRWWILKRSRDGQEWVLGCET